MSDRLFIGRLEVVDVQQLARPRGLGKLRQQRLLFRKRHVLALPATDRKPDEPGRHTYTAPVGRCAIRSAKDVPG
jgi:hypothetical protein